MNISELITKLEELKEKHGDLTVYCDQSQWGQGEDHPVIKGSVLYREDILHEWVYKKGIYISSI